LASNMILPSSNRDARTKIGGRIVCGKSSQTSIPTFCGEKQ